MILYDPDHRFSLIEFGIQIPIRDSKATRSFEFLKTHPQLGKVIDRWYVARDRQRISKTDLIRAHAGAYIDKLYADGLEEEIIRTFELIDEQGNYFRYNLCSHDPTV